MNPVGFQSGSIPIIRLIPTTPHKPFPKKEKRKGKKEKKNITPPQKTPKVFKKPHFSLKKPRFESLKKPHSQKSMTWEILVFSALKVEFFIELKVLVFSFFDERKSKGFTHDAFFFFLSFLFFFFRRR